MLVTLSVLGCEEEKFLQLAPKISLDVCAAAEGTEDCLVDFKQVALSTRVTREIEISNPTSVELNLKEPTFSEDSDPSFRVEHWPDRINGGLSSKMVVSFRPLVENKAEATLLVHSDAANMSKNAPVKVKLVGEGINQGLPQIEIVASAPCEGVYPGSTAPVDFGIVAVGYPIACAFEVFNHGTKDLVLEEISFVVAQTDPGFEFVGRVPGLDPDTGERFESVVPPAAEGVSSSRSFVARGVPPQLGVFEGMIQVQSNDPGCEGGAAPEACAPENSHTRVLIPVKVEGAHAPTAVARIKSVNGRTDYDDRQIEPLDDVMLTAEDSYASSGNLSLAEYRWEIINQPSGSHGFLDDPGSQTPRFMFDNSRNIVAGVDLAGFWAVRLTVLDSRGAASVNEAVVSFNAIPTDAIHVQLVWDHPDSDVDLHLLRELPDGSFDDFSDDDCYFGNCKADYGDLEWFDDPDANPSLDVDDLYGYGPENINIEAPAPGRYLAAVHYWSDHGEGNTIAVLRLFLFGNLHSEYLTELTDADWWDVAIIEWPSREVESINEVTPNVSSGGW